MKIPLRLLKIYLEALSPPFVSRENPIDFNAPGTHFMHHKMLVEFIVEQDGGRSPVGTKDEQKKRLIAAALNNKRNKESRRRTCITPKKK